MVIVVPAEHAEQVEIRHLDAVVAVTELEQWTSCGCSVNGGSDGTEMASVAAQRDRLARCTVVGKPLRLGARGGQAVDGDESAGVTDLHDRLDDGLADLDERADGVGWHRVEHGVPLDQRESADTARFTPSGVEPHPGQPAQQRLLVPEPLIGGDLRRAVHHGVGMSCQPAFGAPVELGDVGGRVEIDLGQEPGLEIPERPLDLALRAASPARHTFNATP